MPDDSVQTPEEMAAHYGPDGPVAAALDWMNAVLTDRDYANAWAHMTDELRLARSQAWLWNNRAFFKRAAETLDEQATMLAAVPSTHPHWGKFAEIELRLFLTAWPPEDYAHIGVASRPRPLAPGLELVLFLRMEAAEALGNATTVSDGVVQIAGGEDEGTAVEAFAQIVVEHDGTRWRVASHNGPGLPTPGWPPVF